MKPVNWLKAQYFLGKTKPVGDGFVKCGTIPRKSERGRYTLVEVPARIPFTSIQELGRRHDELN